MDISFSGSEEGCSSSEKTFDGSKDFISDLPDDILVHILSFLPTRDAINTILLRRFGDLWRSVQVLDFDSCLYHECDCGDTNYTPDYRKEDFVDLIRYVLNHRGTSTVDKLCLNYVFSFICSKDWSFGDGVMVDEEEWEERTAVQIEKLIRYAISRNVKVLDLNLKGCKSVDPERLYDLPIVLSSNYLTYLKLAAFDLAYCHTIDLKSLSILLLHEVSLSDRIMEEILLGCPSLENLSLINCYGLERFNCKNQKLKKVILTLTTCEDDYEPVLILCPHVLSFEINGFLQRAIILDVSSVVDASIHFRFSVCFSKGVCSHVIDILRKFSQCQTFSPCSSTILVLTIRNFTIMRCPSFKWKNLILKLLLTKWHHPGLSLLLRNSPSLETLTMDIHPGPNSVFTTEQAEWIEAHDFDGEEYWDTQEASLPCLKTIKIYGSINLPHVIQMVKFLLRSATQLQKLVVLTSDRKRLPLTTEQLQELLVRFKSLPRASPEANIYFT